VQTFLPYPDFKKTAGCLDWRRLGKQRIEAMLAVYHNTIIEEWISRGYRNSMKIIAPNSAVISPSWLGNSDFHASHRSNLLRKDPEHYAQFGWTESDNLPYVWVSDQELADK
jgi:hypothetical protein